MVPTIPPVMNAIYDAVGVRITSLPATPEKVLMAIRESEQERERRVACGGGRVMLDRPAPERRCSTPICRRSAALADVCAGAVAGRAQRGEIRGVGPPSESS